MKTQRKYLFVLLFVVAVVCAVTAFACSSSLTVQFDTDGKATVAEIVTDKDGEITLPSGDSSTGEYSFEGWYLDPDFSGEMYAAGSTYTVKKNTTFYGKYSQNYPISLNLDGGSGISTTLYLSAGSNVYDFMMDYTPVKTGAEFGKWQYNGSDLSRSQTMPEGGITLTAVYRYQYTIEIYTQDLEQSAYEHTGEYDVTGYEYVGSFELETEPTLTGFTFTANSDDGVYSIDITEDFSSNVLRLYYNRNTLRITLNPNYPDGAESTSETLSIVYGNTISLPSDLTYPGYVLTGWAQNASGANIVAEVDYIGANLYLYDDSTGEYVFAGGELDVQYMPTGNDEMLFAVWEKGYIDMFGGSDSVFVFDSDPSTAYLCRGGVFFASYIYNADMGVYEFYNMSTGSNVYKYIDIRIFGDGMFAYSDDTRTKTMYLYEYTVIDGYLYSSIDYNITLAIDSYDGVTYSETILDDDGNEVETMVSTGSYRLNSEGYIYITFTTGELAGTSMTILDGTVSDSYYTYPVFMIRNDTEYEMGLMPLGGVFEDEGELYVSYYYTDYYSIELTGFGTAYYTYVSGNYIYTSGYYYSYDGDLLTLYNSYGYPAGYFKAVDVYDTAVWFFYYSDLDGDFSVYDGNGNILGTITLDGVYTATYRPVSGSTQRSYYMLDYNGLGNVIITDFNGIGQYVLTSSDGYTYDGLRVVPSSASAYYFVDGYNVYYLQVILDGEQEGYAGVYGYFYSYYYGSFYTRLLYGPYETFVDETFGFTYYVLTVTDTVTSDWGDLETLEYYLSYYGYSNYSVFGLDDFAAMTKIEFVVGEHWYYGYDITAWLRYETGDAAYLTSLGNALAAAVEVLDAEEEDDLWVDLTDVYTRDVDYTYIDDDGNEIHVVGTEYLMLAGNYFVYYAFIPGEGSDLDASRMDGFYYGYYSYEDNGTGIIGDDEIIIVVYFNAYNERGELYGYYGEYYFQTYDDGTFIQLSYPSTIYYERYSQAVGGSFYSGDMLVYYAPEFAWYYINADGSYVLVDLVPTGEDSLTGATIYDLVLEGGIVADQIILLYSSSGYLFVKSSSQSGEYKGNDGSTVNLDGFGFQAIFTDSTGKQRTMYYTIVNSTIIYLYDDDGYMYIELSGSGSKNYTILGSEYGYYYLVENQEVTYLILLDGLGTLEVYDIDYYIANNGNTGSVIGYGTYSFDGDYVYLKYVIGAGADVTQTCEYYASGYLYAEFSDIDMRFMNNYDWSVFELDSFGWATVYLPDGAVEYGWYKILDDSYFYYQNNAGTSGNVYAYDVLKGTVSPETYTAMYYYSDDFDSLIFYANGLIGINGVASYFYVKSGNSVTIYRTPENDSEKAAANRYGVYSYSFGALDDVVEFGGVSYYGGTGSSMHFYRDSATQNQYQVSGYSFLDLTFTPGTGEFYSYGTVLYNSTSYGVYVYRLETTDDDGVGTGKYEMYMEISASGGSYYWIGIDLSVSTGTYTITSMVWEYVMYSYWFLDNYFWYLYYYYYYGMDIGLYYDYYSYVVLGVEYDENSEEIGRYAFGEFTTDSGVVDAAGDGLSFETDYWYDYTSYYGYYCIVVEDEYGFEYELYLVPYGYYYYYLYYYFGLLYMDFTVYAYAIVETVESEYDEEAHDTYYVMEIERMIYSDYSGWSDPLYFELWVYEWNDTYEAYGSSAMEYTYCISTDDGLLLVYYFVDDRTGEIKGTTYYLVTYVMDEEYEFLIDSIELRAIDAKTYYTADGSDYIDFVVDSESESGYTLVIFYKDDTAYLVYDCEYDAESETYSVVIYEDGYTPTTYIITLEDGVITYTEA